MPNDQKEEQQTERPADGPEPGGTSQDDPGSTPDTSDTNRSG